MKNDVLNGSHCIDHAALYLWFLFSIIINRMPYQPFLLQTMLPTKSFIPYSNNPSFSSYVHRAEWVKFPPAASDNNLSIYQKVERRKKSRHNKKFFLFRHTGSFRSYVCFKVQIIKKFNTKNAIFVKKGDRRSASSSGVKMEKKVFIISSTIQVDEGQQLLDYPWRGVNVQGQFLRVFCIYCNFISFICCCRTRGFFFSPLYGMLACIQF